MGLSQTHCLSLSIRQTDRQTTLASHKPSSMMSRSGGLGTLVRVLVGLAGGVRDPWESRCSWG